MYLKVIEGISIVAALTFGILWYSNLSGSFEALSYIALLLGVTVTDYVRRIQNEKKFKNEIKQSIEVLIKELPTLIEESFSSQLKGLDISTQLSIKNMLSEVIPKNVSEAILLLAETNTGQSKKENEISKRLVAAKSLAEAYGVERSANEISDMSIFEAKGNRAKSG